MVQRVTTRLKGFVETYHSVYLHKLKENPNMDFRFL